MKTKLNGNLERRPFLQALLSSIVTMREGRPALSARAVHHGGQGDDWMSTLSAKHRSVFDIAAHNLGKPLHQARNYLDAWRSQFQALPADVNLVLGVHGGAIPIVLDDSMWARYRLGAEYQIIDAKTDTAALRNVFAARHAVEGGLVAATEAVEALQRDRVIVVVCNNTIASAALKLAASGLGASDEIRSALHAHILPGVRVVPAMVVALTQLQEHGLAYIKIS